MNCFGNCLTVRKQYQEQLFNSSPWVLNSRTSVKVSSQNLIYGSFRGLARRPVENERSIGSSRGFVSTDNPFDGVEEDLQDPMVRNLESD